jgi:hypothetical protein
MNPLSKAAIILPIEELQNVLEEIGVFPYLAQACINKGRSSLTATNWRLIITNIGTALEEAEHEPDIVLEELRDSDNMQAVIEVLELWDCEKTPDWLPPVLAIYVQTRMHKIIDKVVVDFKDQPPGEGIISLVSSKSIEQN